jgi:hypothetical protein
MSKDLRNKRNKSGRRRGRKKNEMRYIGILVMKIARENERKRKKREERERERVGKKEEIRLDLLSNRSRTS